MPTPLSSLHEPDLVTSAIARALGPRRAGQNPTLEALAAALRSHPLLPVLDNFEQVVAAAPIVPELLRACPGLAALVTSRTRLHVSGERIVVVPPLAVPTRRVGTHQLLDSEAERLFVERAQAAHPGLVLSEADRSAVGEICRRLDGLPLAIELTAARCGLFTPHALLARFERRLPQLAGGPRDQPARQRTMQDAIARSYDLLSPAEQAVFQCLSVFEGGCTLEAIETVYDGTQGRRDGGTEREQRQHADVSDKSSPPRRLAASPHVVLSVSPSLRLSVPDVVESLLRQSLLAVAGVPDSVEPGSPRLVMLETIREFGLAQLAASGESAAVRSAHAAYCLALAERRPLDDRLPDGDRALLWLDAEHDNLRTALTWLEKAGDSVAFLRLAVALGTFWRERGYFQEGRTWLERALAHLGETADLPDDDHLVRARATVNLGAFEMYHGAFREAEVHLAEGLAGCRDEGDAFHASMALLSLAHLAISRGDRARSVALLEEVLVVAQSVSDRRQADMMAGNALNNLAVVARSEGDHARAVTYLEEALGRMRSVGVSRGAMMALGDLGDLARDQGDYARAMTFYRDALDTAGGYLKSREVADVLEAIGVAAAAAGEAERAARLLGATEAMREQMGLRLRMPENQAALDQALATARAALGEAAFATTWAGGRLLSPEEAVAEAVEPAGGASLTRRETEVLRLLAAGMSDATIAEALFLSVRTVERHVGHIFAKFGVKSRAAAASAGRIAGLIPPISKPDV